MNENKDALIPEPQSPTEPSPNNSEGQIQLPDQKPSKWRYFFIFLGILQILGVALFLMVMSWAAQKAKEGLSGTEFIALFLYATLVPAVGFVALINLIGLPVYLIKHKPRLLGLTLSSISLLISALLTSTGVIQSIKCKLSHQNKQKNPLSNTKESMSSKTNSLPPTMPTPK